AAADILARREHRPALAGEDRAAVHLLAPAPLDAEVLRVRIAAVLGAALTLFMRHRVLSLQLDVLDAHAHQVLPVAVGAAVALAPLHLEDLDLGRLDLVEDDSRDARV